MHPTPPPIRIQFKISPAQFIKNIKTSKRPLSESKHFLMNKNRSIKRITPFQDSTFEGIKFTGQMARADVFARLGRVLADYGAKFFNHR